MKILALASAIISTALIIAPSYAATLVVNGGQLEGAKNVEFEGKFYNVRFTDGTCVSLFSGCDEASDFIFNVTQASGFSQTLLDTVFIDGPEGNFDTVPSLTRGCADNPGNQRCLAIMPVGFQTDGRFRAVYPVNRPDDIFDTIVNGPTIGSRPTANSFINPIATFAVVTLGAVPLPGAALFFFTGGAALLGGRAFKRLTSRIV